MAEDNGGERTEAPTAKRKQKAAEDGQILQSRDLATALVVLAGIAWLLLFGRSLVTACKGVMIASLQFGRADVEDFEPWRPLVEAGGMLAPAILSLFAIAIAAAIVSQGALGSLTFNAKNLRPKPGKLDPIAGFGRIFGVNGWVELGKSLLKVVLLGAIGAWMLWKVSRMTIGLAASDLPVAIGTLGGTFVGVLTAMAAGLLLIGAADVPVQALRLLSKLRMSKQEIKDEHKEAEGSPENKGQLRARARAILKRSTRQAVAGAHVVLTNPTHFAVALRYERGQDQVPVVVAKGRGATALAIREIAAENTVPVLEYPALARAVYYTSQEGQEIRDDLYLPIATVLAFVFGLNAQAGGRAQPAVDVPAGARFDENGILAS